MQEQILKIFIICSKNKINFDYKFDTSINSIQITKQKVVLKISDPENSEFQKILQEKIKELEQLFN